MAMEMRVYGRTGMQLSVLGFGCGAVGGLMVRGDPRDQERAIARALAVGVNYFDTAVQYGNGESEKNLGRILQTLKPANAIVGTKVRLPSAAFGRIADTITQSLEASLARFRFLGLTAIGSTPALHQVIDAGGFDSAQVVYNMLNPSAAMALPANYPAQDYGRLFDHTKAAGTGVIAIRVLAGGALSGSAERHPIASPPPEPIGSAMSYDADIARARRLMPLVTEGFAASLTEAATRFAIGNAAVGTILVGMATPQQFEDALAAVEKGPLPAAALERLEALRQGFVGEPR
jgi:aryl-alcohol dehydrogenase-like predicted oxidoreductase